MAGRDTPTKLPTRSRATVAVERVGDVALAKLNGLVDEHFEGFGELGNARTVALDISGLTRMTSFGVQKWIKALDGLPRSGEVYLLACPTFFVDQLNMVLNFGGGCKVVTAAAPFSCPSCGKETSELVDVVRDRTSLLQGTLAPRKCADCGNPLQLDESPETYFQFARVYGATHVDPAAARMLAAKGLYAAATTEEVAPEKPIKVIKLVHGEVTYFRLIGTIGSTFRARPFLIGAEGEIVIDLAEVDRFDASALQEWKRLLKSLVPQVPSVTLVDVNQSFLSTAVDTLTLARNIIVASLLVARRCAECGRVSHDSASLAQVTWPISFRTGVCSRCGGTTESQMTPATLVPLQKASTVAPKASAKVIAQRDELLSRALTDAHIAEAGDGASAEISADDMILGKYKVVQQLSVGGMAEVFLANQIGIGGFTRPVALKRIQRKLLESRHMAIDMFLNEAKIAGRLTHPNIVQVLDVGEAGGCLYLAMEYVHGKDLRAVTKRLRHNKGALVPLGEALFIVREVAQALHHAYWSSDMTGKRLSVVHRDVSPHNIIMGYDGAVKLIDFGVAVSSVTEHAESFVVGKWHYMAPETTTKSPIDHRSDLFSLGVILYLLVSGQMPFTDREPKEIIKKIRAGQYRPLDEVAVVPEALAKLTHRMLSTKPEHRPERGEEVVAELDEIARVVGITSSNAKIAELLADLFPDEAGSPYEEAALEIQVGEASPPGTPTPRSSISPFKGGIDASIALHRRTSTSMSVQPGPSSKSISTQPGPVSKSMAAQAPQAPKYPVKAGGNTRIKLLVLLLVLAAVGAAAYFLWPLY